MMACLHQPNYIPSLTTISKIAQSDVYIIMDDVKFPQGKSFSNRNRIKTPQGPLWLTLPVMSGSGLLQIKEVKLVDDGWNLKHWKTIEANYKRAPFFDKYANLLFDIYQKNWPYLQDVNLCLLGIIKSVFNIKTEFIYSSELEAEGTGKDKILNLLKKAGADSYITGWGAGSKRHIQEKDFKEAGIKLIKQDFKHPIYPQLWGKEFIPNLSIIDYLFNKGVDDFEKDCNIK